MKDPLPKIKLTVKPAFGNALEIIVKQDLLICKENINLSHLSNLQLEYQPPEFRLKLTEIDYGKLIGNISEISIPPIPSFAGGFDGDTTELQFNNGSNNTSFTWWDKRPEAWKPLGDCYERIIAYAQEKSPKE